MTQCGDCGFTESELSSAVQTLKDWFKQQKIEYGLCAVRVDGEVSRSLLAATPQPDDGGRYLALVCDYNVYDDMGADKVGYYPDAVFVLKQQSDGSWTLPQTPGEEAALQPLVCPLELHRAFALQ